MMSLFLRLAAVSAAVWLLLGSPLALGAQTDTAGAPVESTIRLTEPVATRHVVVHGEVVLPDGSPALDAVVVSSAGGLAAVGADGRFELEVELAPEVEALELTAVGNGPDGSLTARRRAEVPRYGISGQRLDLPAGRLQLSASQGCVPSWLPTFGGQAGVNGFILALCVFDDGSGPALYAGGLFTTAGGQAANRIARWDGSFWSALGSGMNSDVEALCVFDDGSGSALYAGGSFSTAGGVAANRIARWDGQTWSALGTGVTGANSSIDALCVFDDGSGSALFAGGNFNSAGGQPASRIARWDGQAWSPLGAGVNNIVSALCVFDDGSGSALYAAGAFTLAGGQNANRIARWDGQVWRPLGSGLNGNVLALAVFDDGTGSALYVAGQFFSAGDQNASRIARWDGQAWSPLGLGVGDLVRCLAAFDDGRGPALYAGGTFFSAGGQPASRIAKWDGQAWSVLGSGVNSGSVYALAVFDDTSGSALYAGGTFHAAGGVGASCIARWDGQVWSTLGSGLSDAVRTLTVFDDGSGSALYVGGPFASAGGQAASRIARWDGQAWSALGSGVGSNWNTATVHALAGFDDGTGPALYAGGVFTLAGGQAASAIARWDGQAWSPLGAGVSHLFTTPQVHALAVFDDGTGAALYAGGVFTSAGGQAASNIARWDGQAWSALGSGLDGAAVALAVFDDGSGPALYAGGGFPSAGGQTASRIARWDGQAWSPLGPGVTDWVHALAVFDDGSGSALYAGGNFVSSAGQFASRIARWDGQAWSPLGSGVNDRVEALCVFDDGSGSALYAGGQFSSAGGQAASRIARWDGSAWSSLGAGVANPLSSVVALAGFQDGSGSALYAGGTFELFPGGESFLAKWAGCAAPGFATLAGCFGNPALLDSPSPGLSLGRTALFEVQSPLGVDGVALLYGGLNGTGLDGCGLLLPGLGEFLLAFSPQPFQLAIAPAPQGQAQFAVPVLNQPQWVGLSVAFQGAFLATSLPGAPLELSNALLGTVTL